MQYRVSAAKVSDVTKVHEQCFRTFATAEKARDYLKSKGYRAVVQVIVSKINSEVMS